MIKKEDKPKGSAKSRSHRFGSTNQMRAYCSQQRTVLKLRMFDIFSKMENEVKSLFARVSYIESFLELSDLERAYGEEGAAHAKGKDDDGPL